LENDDMSDMYSLFRRADLVVVGTPIFFYGPPAQLKGIIDRSQTLWARRYVRKLSEPKSRIRQGFLLAVGATRGARLFEGVDLIARYFFDAVSANYKGFLGYREVEGPRDIEHHPTALTEAFDKGRELAEHLMRRPKVLFVCRDNARRSQMAEAFVQWGAGDRFEAESCGDTPAREIDPSVVEVMAEKGLDVAFRRPKGFAEVSTVEESVDVLVTMGCEVTCPAIPAKRRIEWDLDDPKEQRIETVRRIRDEIEERIHELTGITAVEGV
jgi:protein-tyrosine-phosphatase